MRPAARERQPDRQQLLELSRVERDGAAPVLPAIRSSRPSSAASAASELCARAIGSIQRQRRLERRARLGTAASHQLDGPDGDGSRRVRGILGARSFERSQRLVGLRRSGFRQGQCRQHLNVGIACDGIRTKQGHGFARLVARRVR